MKKILSIILTMSLILSLGIPVYATEIKDMKMEEMTYLAKQRLDITESKDFRSTTSNIEDGMIKKNEYNLRWEFDDYQLSTVIREDGFISEYYKSQIEYEKERKLLFTVTKDEAKAKADAFILQLNPDISNEYKFQEIRRETYSFYYANLTSRLSGDNYVASYVREVNGLSFKPDIMTVYVSGHTGEIVSYNGTYHANIDFPEFSKEIDLAKAKNLFKENLELEYTYRIKDEYKENENGEWINEPYTILVYTDKTQNHDMDANTGKIYNADEHYIVYQKYANSFGAVEESLAAGSSDSMNAVVDKYALTEQELNEIKDTKDVLAPEKVLSIIKETNYFNLSDSTIVESYRLFKNDDGTKTYNLYFKDNLSGSEISVTADANTGKIISYRESNNRHYYYDNNTKYEKLQYAKKFVQEYFENASHLNYDIEDLGTSFRFERIENGIVCPDNYVYVKIDKETNKVVSYNYTWTDVEFIDPSTSISEDEAKNLFIDAFDYKLYYYVDTNLSKTETNNRLASLIYTYENPKGSIINAQTKEFLSYSLYDYDKYNEPEKIKVAKDYTDISGHWAENIIKLMQNNEIGVAKTEFKPNEALTYDILFELLGTNMSEEYFDEFKAEFMSLDDATFDFINEGTKLTNTLTREEFISIMIKIGTYQYDKIINKSDFFKTNYLDENLITKNKIGYITIARMLEYLSGDYFRPLDKITRAEAITYLYNIYTKF